MPHVQLWLSKIRIFKPTYKVLRFSACMKNTARPRTSVDIRIVDKFTVWLCGSECDLGPMMHTGLSGQRVHPCRHGPVMWHAVRTEMFGQTCNPCIHIYSCVLSRRADACAHVTDPFRWSLLFTTEGLNWNLLFYFYTFFNSIFIFQLTSPRPVGAPALCQLSHLHQCLQRGPPLSPNATQRTNQLWANTSIPRRTWGRTPATSQWAFSCPLRLPRLPCRHTNRPPLHDSTFTPTTSTISTHTPTRFLSQYRCCSILRAHPPSLLSDRLLSRCISWFSGPSPVQARLSHTQMGHSVPIRCSLKCPLSTKEIADAPSPSASSPWNCELCSTSLPIKNRLYKTTLYLNSLFTLFVLNFQLDLKMTTQKRKTRKKMMMTKRSTMERSPNQSWSREAADAWLETEFVSSQGIAKRKRKTKKRTTREEGVCAGRTATRTARCSIKRTAQMKTRRTSPH